MCAKRNALGKGLTALLSDSQPATPGEGTVPVNTVSEIPLDQIEANPFQPREHITEENLEGLVKSIQGRAGSVSDHFRGAPGLGCQPGRTGACAGFREAGR